MGEAADDVLDGLVCECCGEWMQDFLDSPHDKPFEAPGYPRRCEACSPTKVRRRGSKLWQ